MTITPETIARKLLAIAPNVAYEEKKADDEQIMHTWTVRERSSVPYGKMALFCILGDLRDITDDEISEGCRRYEESA